VDNQQFIFGMSLKTEEKNKFHEVVSKAKKYFVTEVMKFDPNKMCLCTILFEGTKFEVETQQKIIYGLAKKHQGFRAGS
jgi:alkyldihydroxyacetonephosphate synthase